MYNLQGFNQCYIFSIFLFLLEGIRIKAAQGLQANIVAFATVKAKIHGKFNGLFSCNKKLISLVAGNTPVYT